MLLWSCEKDSVSTEPENKTIETDLLRIQPSIVEQLNFIVSYERSDTLTWGYLISTNGKVTKFEFDQQTTSSPAPGSYESIVNYFADAEKNELPNALSSSISTANFTALELMSEYDRIVNDTSVISASAQGKGTCQIYHVQKSDEGVSPEQYYPVRILEGTYDNTWFVKNSDSPEQLLIQLDAILSVDNGLDMDFWEHYVEEESKL